ncbi:MAG: GNAT family N-acetyltransferase [Caldilineaceae bacterium]|nr:GNAT family N-acetyltransferase [Caldilineaceae bacterium]
MAETWGAAAQVVRGALFYPHELPGLLAQRVDGTILGVATYRLLDPLTCELATLNSLQSGLGVGAALITAVAATAQTLGSLRLVVVTTNDNLHALRFYQRRGFVISAVRIGAVNEARRTLKPEIPLLGDDEIPLRDEIELALDLRREASA